MEETKEEYITPMISVVFIGDIMQDTLPVSNHKGNGNTGLAKPFMEDEEDVEANKWGTTLPTSVPDAWKQVGE